MQIISYDLISIVRSCSFGHLIRLIQFVTDDAMIWLQYEHGLFPLMDIASYDFILHFLSRPPQRESVYLIMPHSGVPLLVSSMYATHTHRQLGMYILHGFHWRIYKFNMPFLPFHAIVSSSVLPFMSLLVIIITIVYIVILYCLFCVIFWRSMALSN